jgi:hypothetical protein
MTSPIKWRQSKDVFVGNELISFCQPALDEGPSRVPPSLSLLNLLPLLYYCTHAPFVFIHLF